MSIVSIGNFDGVHLGHRKILIENLNLASKKREKSSVFSIMYPYNYYKKNFEGLIYSIDIRIEKILEIGIERIMTASLSEIEFMSPDEFVLMLLNGGASGIVVGEDFRFGKNGTGDRNTLKKLSKKYKFELKIINDIKEKDQRISSSLIKKFIRSGDIPEINSLLGSPYILYGKIIEETGEYFIQRSFEKLIQLRDGKYIFLYDKKEIEINVNDGVYKLPGKIAQIGTKIELQAVSRLSK